MDASVSHVPGVAKRFNASATPTRKRTTAPDARPMEEYSRIAACPVSSDRTGHGHWRNWKRSPDPQDPRFSRKSSGEPLTRFLVTARAYLISRVHRTLVRVG